MDGVTSLHTDSRNMRWTTCAVLLCTGTILYLMRRHAFDVPLETDECNYIYIAQRLLAGDRLYVDVWDHQPFGVYTFFAGIVSIFGHEPIVFRNLAVITSLCSLTFVYLIARKSGGLLAGIAAAICFSLASSDPGTAGDGCNREIFMNLLILVSWYLVGSMNRHKPGYIFFAGLSLGLASCLKTVVVVHWLLLALWMAWDYAQHANASRKIAAITRSLLWFATGPAILWTTTASYFWLTGRLWDFIDAVFLFNLQYSQDSGSSLARFWQFFYPAGHPFIFDSAFPLWITAIPATLWLMYLSLYRKDKITLGLLPLLLIACYVAVCLPGRAWPHYYYLLIPPLCIVIPTSISHFTKTSTDTNKSLRIRSPLCYVAITLLVTSLLWTQYTNYISQPTFGITVTRYNSRDFWGRAIGEKIRSVTDPGDSIFVYGNEAEMYYYANRKCATRYTMITGIRTDDPTAAHRRKNLIDDLLRDRPRVIVVLFDEKPFSQWSAYLRQHYGPAIGWDCHDRHSDECDQPDPSWVTMLVYQDPDRPINPISWSWDRKQVGGWHLGQQPSTPLQSESPPFRKSQP